MGNTKSHFRKLSRRNSFSMVLRTSSSKFTSDQERSSNGVSLSSRSHSLASNTTGGSDISRLSVPDTYNDSISIKDQACSGPNSNLSSDQLSLVKCCWHLVSVDTSNVCMNFFHQLQRQFSTPKTKKSLQKQKSATHSSTPSLSHLSGNGNTYSFHHRDQIIRNQSISQHCQKNSSNSGSGNRSLTQGQLTQQALKLACCLDAVIGSLARNSKVKEEKLVKMLCDNGHQFKSFLGLDNFFTDTLVVREMTNAFCESLKLVVIQNGLNWSQELQEAWEAIFRILLYHLDGLSEIEDEDDDMLWWFEFSRQNYWWFLTGTKTRETKVWSSLLIVIILTKLT